MSVEDRGGPIRDICVVGGGTAGWIAAALLSHYANAYRVTLVESEEIGTIGVGESTIPPFLQLLARLGVSESEFIRETSASFKLGIRFDDWHAVGESYFHPFGFIGGPPGTGDAYQLWLRARAAGSSLPLQALAPASVMAERGRFTLPFKAPASPVGGAAYALHVDARRVALFLRRFAEQRGVARQEGIVETVEHAGDQVSAVRLRDGRRIAADFFLDCTGFRSLLIGQTLGAPLDDWSHLLPCDRAVVVQTQNVGPPPPFTVAAAQRAGWRWRIPLQHRTGNGHVYSSRHMDDDQARETLLDGVEGPTVTEPHLLRFQTGARREMWKGNVVGIGLAAGFVEPLESTAIHLVYRAMDILFRFMPPTGRADALAAEFNRRMFSDYVEIRDFLVAHYSLTARRDTPFWRDVAAVELPPELHHRLEMFEENGTVPATSDALFNAVSWQSVLEGMGVRPREAHPLASTASGKDIALGLDGAAAQLVRAVDALPTHQQFIDRHCKADEGHRASAA